MKSAKRARLQQAGWKIGSAQEFLGLTEEEMALIEMRLALGRSLKQRRLASGMTQQEVASRVGSSQSRIAKMESADPAVSIDLFVRSLLKLGATRQEVGRIIARRVVTPAA
ncbi:MAG: helix-turn-helix domain-containing protein [Planctomycetota bacterium]|nr:helix-turn-helix domain-containing protein [Planctomycetota bacterium]